MSQTLYNEVLAALQFARDKILTLNETLSIEERRALLAELKEYPALVELVRNQIPMSEWHLIGIGEA